jgi:hypothetical protein
MGAFPRSFFKMKIREGGVFTALAREQKSPGLKTWATVFAEAVRFAVARLFRGGVLCNIGNNDARSSGSLN